MASRIYGPLGSRRTKKTKRILRGRVKGSGYFKSRDISDVFVTSDMSVYKKEKANEVNLLAKERHKKAVRCLNGLLTGVVRVDFNVPARRRAVSTTDGGLKTV